MVFIKLEESGYIYFEIFVFYFSLLKGSTIHQELEMNRFSPVQKRVGTSRKEECGSRAERGNRLQPRAPPLLGGQKSPGTRRKENRDPGQAVGLFKG